MDERHGEQHEPTQTDELVSAEEVPPLCLGRYRTVPELSTPQYEALRESIRIHGLQVPVEIDEDGAVLDGEARVRACSELGITDYPIIIRLGLSEEEKRGHALRLNLNRRHLTSGQRRQLLCDELARDPSRSDYAIAEVCASTHTTVRRHRDRLTAAGTIPAVDAVVARNGDIHPARKPRRPGVFVGAAHDLGAVGSDLAEVEPCELGGEIHSADAVTKAADTKRARAARRECALGGDDGCGGNTDAGPAEPTDQVDLIVADGGVLDGDDDPYGQLAALASELLRPGAMLLIRVPKRDLALAFRALDGRLEYVWTFAEVRSPAASVVDPVPVQERWHAVLLFRRAGQSRSQVPVTDLFCPGDGDGTDSLLDRLVDSYTQPGDAVLDLTGGDQLVVGPSRLIDAPDTGVIDLPIAAREVA